MRCSNPPFTLDASRKVREEKDVDINKYVEKNRNTLVLALLLLAVIWSASAIEDLIRGLLSS